MNSLRFTGYYPIKLTSLPLTCAFNSFQKHLVKETMMNMFNGVSVSLMMFTVACLGKTVLQTPGDILTKKDESAVITCSHKIQSYDRILWYKQSQDSLGLKLMGYLYVDSKNKEPGFENKINLEGNGRNKGILTLSNLTLTDSAVYFCAAYYTVLRTTSV
ncbi:hypothetical protein cypCar_00040525 [Cyprinus carpio]|nr:hypothetical protein cypCar_00040525 [Cyprinus carpio]